MEQIRPEDVLYEDNHLIVVNKHAGENVQGDISGDFPLVEKVREYIRHKFEKPGNVFCGLIHRLDRPVSGAIAFARTSKALTRMNKLFAEKHPRKVYWAVVEKAPKEKSGHLVHHLVRNEKQNKTYTYTEARKDSKEARLKYRLLLSSDNYTLLEVELETGRHHQIRAQLAAIGCIIKGDLKYGAKRSNPDGSIYLHSRELEFEHPTTKETVKITAPVPKDNLWQWFEKEESAQRKKK
ncbi:RNA pseudouridine synthase [Fluviicola sp.]|uniref:RluA family pseudouridine synthase n=1 Tax=Fluviicola sp. TaxID=1917219 RepID=UPI0031E1B5FA